MYNMNMIKWIIISMFIISGIVLTIADEIEFPILEVMNPQGNFQLAWWVNVTNGIISDGGMLAINDTYFEGIFNSSAWLRNGTNVHLKNSGDNVGIGTASPSAQLEIVNNQADNTLKQLVIKGLATQTANELEIQFEASKRAGVTGLMAGTAGWLQVRSDSASGGGMLTMQGTTAGPFMIFGSVTDDDKFAKVGAFGNVFNFQANTRDLNFRSGTLSSIMVLEHDTGNVGIGTASPGYKLEVNGSLQLSEDNNKLFFGTAEDISHTYDGTSYNITQEVGSTPFNFIGFNNYTFDNRVGIGTGLPDSVFHIKANIAGNVGSHSAGQIIIQNPADDVTSNVVITGYESDGSGNPDQQLWYLGSSSSSNSNIILLNRRNALLQFGTNGITHMTMSGNGNVDFTKNITIGDKITFAFGEIIDNLVNGWLRITGNLNVTGNITSENVFIKQYIFSHTNITLPLITANVWRNITFDQEITAIKFGISHTFDDNTNHTFTFSDAGVYNLEYDFDMVDTSPSASNIDAAGRIIYVNGTEIDGSAFETDITKIQVETELSHSTLARFVVGDTIAFQFTADDVDVSISTHGTFGDHPDSATIIIEKVANL